MKRLILHNSYSDRVIENYDRLVVLLDNEEFFLSYVNLANFRLEARSEVTAFIVDSSTLANAIGVNQMSPDYSSVMSLLLSKSSRILYIGGRIEENIEFIRKPNYYSPDMHTALQFFHM